MSEKLRNSGFEKYICNTPSQGPHHHNSFLLRAGLEPGIPAREAGALTRNAKGYSASFWGQASEVYTQPLLAYIRYI